MADYNSRDWPVKEPPEDFVERTAAAMLRARSAAQRRTRTRRWIVAGALAAVLVNAAAFAMVVQERRAAREALPLPAATQPAPEPARTARTTPTSMGPIAPEEPAASPPKPPASNGRRRPATSASASSSAAPAPSSSFKPPAPRCDCVEGVSMCSCME